MSIALALSPLLVVGIGALLLMLVEAFSSRQRRRGRSPAASRSGRRAVLFAGAAFAAARLDGRGRAPRATRRVAPWLIIDRFTLFFDMTLCLGGALAALLAGGYLPEHQLERGEFYSLILFATFGAMMLAAAGDALTLFLGLETMSIGAYAMTAFRRASPRSAEGALKYFLLGSFAAALLIYGFALLYGATGHTDLAGIGAAARTAGATQPARSSWALVLVLVGHGVQGERGAVPRVDARRLRRRADAGDGVHGRRGEGGSVRDAAARARRCRSATRGGRRGRRGWPPGRWRRSPCSR